MTDEVVLGLPPVSLDAVYARCTRDVYPPLDTEGARRFGGRFNPPGIPALYLAPSAALALQESARSADLAAFKPFAPRRVVCVRVRLSAVLELTSAEAAGRLGLTEADLTADWTQAEDLAATQVAGDRLFRARAEGVLFPSRLDARAVNLMVFPDNLRAHSLLQVVEDVET